MRNQISNSVIVTHLLLKSLPFKHNLNRLKTKLEDHSEYPSMLSIYDCLLELKIDTIARKLDPSVLEHASYPFIAHLSDNGGRYILLEGEGLDDRYIIYSDENNQSAPLPKTDFLQKWTGNSIFAQVGSEKKEAGYLQTKWSNIIQSLLLPALIIILFCGAAFAALEQSSNLTYLFLLSVYLLGICITSILLINSIDGNNPVIQNLCNLINNNGCNSILRSKAARVTSWLSWSEVGFFYFVGSALALLMSPYNLLVIAFLNLMALPYTIFSFFYQYRHRNWCLLCCLVQGVLLLGLGTIIFQHEEILQNYFPIVRGSFVQTAYAFLLPTISWFVLKPFFTQSIQLTPLRHQLQKFKYNSTLFDQILVNQPHYNIDDSVMPIALGNNTAKNVITIVSNPFCGPCADAHKTIDGWLEYRNDLQVKIIFSTKNNEADERTKVARHIGAVAALNDHGLLKKALIDWYHYNIGRYATWANKYPVVVNGIEVEMIEKHKEWCDKVGVTSTPTIFVNGYKLPDPYRLDDIKYLIT